MITFQQRLEAANRVRVKDETLLSNSHKHSLAGTIIVDRQMKNRVHRDTYRFFCSLRVRINDYCSLIASIAPKVTAAISDN